MAVQLLPKRRALQNPTLVHLFSSSADSDDKKDRLNSSLTDFFKDVKSSLTSQSKPQPSRPFKLRGPSISDPPPPPPSPPQKIANLEEIRKSLTSFQNPSSDTKPSFKSDFNRNSVRERPFQSNSFVSNFRNLVSPNNAGGYGRQSPSKIGAVEDLPASVFGKELNEMNEEANSLEARMGFARPYDHDQLGEKLRELRPVKRENEWFSMEELSSRLIKLREIEDKEAEEERKNKGESGLKTLMKNLKLMDIDDNKKIGIDLSSIIGEPTREYMNLPPKEHLLEIYNHPDNMSAAEKMKIELAKVRDEFKMSESDCGSTRVQVALLTTKIKYLSSVLHKKDKHSRKGLVQMVNKRKSLLKYLRRTDWESYCFVLDKLGLRDVSNYKS